MPKLLASFVLIIGAIGLFANLSILFSNDSAKYLFSTYFSTGELVFYFLFIVIPIVTIIFDNRMFTQNDPQKQVVANKVTKIGSFFVLLALGAFFFIAMLLYLLATGPRYSW